MDTSLSPVMQTSEARRHALEILVEVQERLRLVSVYVKFSEKLVQPPQLTNSETNFSIRIADSKYEFGLADLKLVENTAALKQIEGSHLYFQCRSKPDDSISGSFDLEFLSLGKQKSEWRSLKPSYEVKRGTEYTVTCTACNFPVIQSVVFKRVLSLPSDDWESSSTDWFCHEHGQCGGGSRHDDKAKKMKLTLDPNVEDCFYGSCFWVINEVHLKYVGDQPDLKCVKCGSLVCKKTGSRCILWNHAVQWTSRDSQSNPRSAFLDAIRLVGSICDEYPPLTKIVFTAESETGPLSLMVWPMDKNGFVLTNNGSGMLKSCAVYKVLYQLCPSGSTLSDWKKDFSSKFVEVPQKIITELLQQLSESSSVICESSRKHNKFLIGFLNK